MKFFNIDLHIGVIGDIRSILTALGHEVTDWTLSAHAWVVGRERDPVEVINHQNWRQIDREMADRFYEVYRDKLSHFDAFIVTHTPCFAMLFEKWKKPIITVASTRYEQPFSADETKWSQFNDFLRRGIDEGIIIPVANSKYDAQYAQRFTGREWQVIPSICDYTSITYDPRRTELLVFNKGEVPLDRKLFQQRDSLKPNRLQRVFNRLPFFPKYHGFDWSDVGTYRGVVHFPYNASIMSIFEHYSGNIPLFFPSRDFSLELLSRREAGIFSELSFNQVQGLLSGSSLSTPAPDPNNYDNVEELSWWVNLSDFYDSANMPHIQYFSSYDQLSVMVQNSDYQDISNRMRAHNIIRKRAIYQKWEDLLQRIN